MGKSNDSPRRSLPSQGGDRNEATEGSPGPSYSAAHAARAERAGRNGRFRVERVRGEPYEVGGWRLIPVARIASFGKAKATIGTKQVSGWAGGFARVTPLAVVAETPEGERQIAITDRASQAVRGMVLGAVAMLLFFGLIRWLVRRNRAQACDAAEA